MELPSPTPTHCDSSVSSTSSLNPCKWTNPPCFATFEDPESLYDHITIQHIGRKSTHNLCLHCHWDDCKVAVTKRDHITSHIRVHVPLKPFQCDVGIFFIYLFF